MLSLPIMMELHEEIRRARKELGLSQGQLSALCGVQRRQLSTLERGGNVTLNTLRKVIGFLPNLEEFTFEQVRMKPTYIDLPPFEWQVFYANMDSLHETLDGMKTALREWLDNPPSKEVDPEVLTKRTTNLATEILKHYAKLSRQETAKRRKTAPQGKETTE
jgi:transcriptional regulator with XRE-family HTH domain